MTSTSSSRFVLWPRQRATVMSLAAALALVMAPVQASWTALQPQYGTVIDFHTRKPIAGALVVAMWETHDDSHSIRFRGAAWLGETITDAEGRFRFDPKDATWTGFPVDRLVIDVVAPGYAETVVTQDLQRPRPYLWQVGDPIALVTPNEGLVIDGQIRRGRQAVTDRDRYDDEISTLNRMLSRAFTGGAEACPLARRVPNAIRYVHDARARHRYQADGYDPVGEAMICLQPTQQEHP